MREYTISEKEEGLTLYKYASRVLRKAQGGLIYKFLRNKNIELNGKKADSRRVLSAGDKVAFFLSDETFEKLHGSVFAEKGSDTDAESGASGIEEERILYEDDDYLFYDKPAGLRTQQDGSGKISLNDMLLSYTGYDGTDACRPSVCNRLDTNTSGIVLCGKSVRGLQALGRAVRERRIRKCYRGIVYGKLKKDMHLVSYIRDTGRDTGVEVSDMPKDGAREAILDVRLLAGGDNASYAEFDLVTGRKHQIRAQMAHIGHPLLGDIKYGRGITDCKGILRQMLHSYRTELPEDILSGMTVYAPVPADIEKCLKQKGIIWQPGTQGD